MQGRYEIIGKYYGLFDDKKVLCVTDSLTDAINICDAFSKVYEDRPFDFDFKKTTNKIDEILDYYPGESLFDKGEIINCKNMEELKKIKKERYGVEVDE